MPIPVSARSESQVCCRPIAVIAGSNPAGGMDVFFLILVVCCVGSGLCDDLIIRPDESYSLCECVCVCVCVCGWVGVCLCVSVI